MISVIENVSVASLEGFCLLYLLGKEEVKSRKAKCMLFSVLVICAASASYFYIPLMPKYVMQISIIIFAGRYAYRFSTARLGFYAVSHVLILSLSEFLAVWALGFFDLPVLTVNLAYEDFRISLILVAKAFHFLTACIFRKLTAADREVLSRYEIVSILLSGILFIAGFAVVNVNIMHILDHIDKVPVLTGDAAVLAAFVLNVIFAERYIKVKKQAEEEKQKVMQMELQYEYYERKQEDMQYIRQIYHDLKNHLLLLDDDTVSGQTGIRIKAVEDYYETGNEFLDVIISDKMHRASEKNIQLECDIDFTNGSFMQPLDISTVFGNLLDNAIEASEKLDMDEKYIFCRAKQKRSLMVILVQNHFAVSKIRDMKEKSYMHGFGLKNVQDAVRKYGGECCVEKEADIFRVSIVIPIPAAV